jgi:hypothetical protein
MIIPLKASHGLIGIYFILLGHIYTRWQKFPNSYKSIQIPYFSSIQTHEAFTTTQPDTAIANVKLYNYNTSSVNVIMQRFDPVWLLNLIAIN